MPVVCDNMSIGRTLRGMSHGKPGTTGERVYMSAAASSLCLRQKAACKKSGEYSSQRCGNRGESAFAQRTVTLCDQTLIWRVEHVST